MRGEATARGRKLAFDLNKIQVWSKGKTKETDERVAGVAQRLASGYKVGAYVPWSKGLSKENDERIAAMADKVSLTHQTTALRQRLDQLKRLTEDEIRKRIEVEGGTLQLISANDYVNDATPNIIVRCITCGVQTCGSMRKLQYHRCFNCNPMGSAAQSELAEFIKSLNVQIETNDRRVVCPLELDIFVPEHKLAIEYNGLYWHCINQKSSTYHQTKSERCTEVGVNLMHIFEDEWRDKRPIVESMIRHKLDLTPNRTSARKCVLVELSIDERRSFFDANHIDGDTNAKFALGLKQGDQALAAMSFRTPFHKKYQKSLEVARLCTKTQWSVAGGLSRLTEAARKKANVDGYTTLLTYVDSRLGTRESWSSAGWQRTGETSPRFWWTDFHDRFNRFKFKADAKRGLTEAQVAEEVGVVKIWGCKNVIYSINLSCSGSSTDATPDIVG